MSPGPPRRTEIISRLNGIEDQIRSLGVRRLALFGSVARGEDHPESDVDILVSFDPALKTYDNYFALCELLEGVLERSVDVVTLQALSPYIGPHILAEAEDVLRAA